MRSTASQKLPTTRGGNREGGRWETASRRWPQRHRTPCRTSGSGGERPRATRTKVPRQPRALPIAPTNGRCSPKIDHARSDRSQVSASRHSAGIKREPSTSVRHMNIRKVGQIRLGLHTLSSPFKSVRLTMVVEVCVFAWMQWYRSYIVCRAAFPSVMCVCVC